MVSLEYCFDKGRWILVLFKYQPSLIKFIKTNFYPALFKHGYWFVPFNLENYKKLFKMKDVTPSDQLVEKVRLERKKLELHDKDSVDLTVPGFNLWPFQTVGVQFLLDSEGRAILAEDMGAGKSVQTLAYMSILQPFRTLIVCPSSVKFNWKLEINKWLKTQPVVLESQSNKTIKESKAVLNHGGIIVANYEAVKKLEISRVELLVLDEHHLVKTRNANRTKVITKIAANADKLVCLSGTPMPNRPNELFNVLKMIDGANWFSFVKYALRYCAGNYQYFYKKKILRADGASNLEELKEKLKPYMLRFEKKDILNDLPELRRDNLEVTLENYDEYRDFEEEIIEEIKSNKDSISKMINKVKSDDTIPLLVKIDKLQELTANLKVKAVGKWIKDFLLISKEKIVIFAYHKSVVASLKNELSNFTQVESITGDTPVPDREDLINDFIKDPELRVLVLSRVGTLGINLVNASTAIFMERDWTPANEEQAEARLHRPGQKNPVMIWYAFAPGTIDVNFASILEEKKHIVGKLLNRNQLYGLIANSLIEGR